MEGIIISLADYEYVKEVRVQLNKNPLLFNV